MRADLRARPDRGLAEEAGELHYRSQVTGLRPGAELAQRHVVDHALAQWAGRLVRISHGSVSCDELRLGNHKFNTGQTLSSNLSTPSNPGTNTAVAV